MGFGRGDRERQYPLSGKSANVKSPNLASRFPFISNPSTPRNVCRRQEGQEEATVHILISWCVLEGPLWLKGCK